MSKHIVMTAVSRDRAGKGNARATRRQGKVPAVIYGDNKAPIMIAIDNLPVVKALHSGRLFTTLCDLNVDGKKHLVLARDVQLHPVKDTPEHVDFLRVSEKTTITVEIPVQALNFEKSPASKQGGTLNMVHFQIEISCRADQIPESIEVDVSEMEMADVINISDLKFPNNVTPTLGADEAVISVTAKMAEEVEEAPAESAEVPAINQKDEEEK